MNQVIYLAPNIKTTDISQPMTFDGKVQVFENSVLGWQLEIADALINGNNGNPLIPNSGYATLSVIASYPEMMWQFKKGKCSNRRSKQAFREGMAMIFSNVDLTDRSWVDAIDFIYDQLRCGLYHDGSTRRRVLTSGHYPHPIEIDSQNQLIKINPHRLTQSFVQHFKDYVTDIRASGENGEVGRNFVTTFDR